MYKTPDPVLKRTVVEVVGLNFKVEGSKLKIKAKNAYIAMYRIRKGLWERNVTIEPPISLPQQPLRDYYDTPIFLGAEDGSQIEPFTRDKLNYTTFFANREQTELLVFQLKQLNNYLQIKQLN